MTKDEVLALCTKLGHYIIEEFESYNLDFGIDKPYVGASRFNYAYLNLFGKTVPEDVTESDKGVLKRFLYKVSNEFMETYGYDCSIVECDCAFESGPGYLDDVEVRFFVGVAYQNI